MVYLWITEDMHIFVIVVKHSNNMASLSLPITHTDITSFTKLSWILNLFYFYLVFNNNLQEEISEKLKIAQNPPQSQK